MKLDLLVNSKQQAVNRILWIDVVRGIIIILVVLGHNIQFGCGTRVLNNQLFFENPVFRFIYSFHMPCLMLLSGYFFGFSVNKPQMWKRRCQTIVIPTIAWSLIPAGLTFAKAVLKHELNWTVMVSCLRIIISYYWFLWAILFGTLIVWIVHRFLEDSIIAYLVLGIGFLFVPKILNTYLWIFMYPYSVTGYLWNTKKVRIKWAEKHRGITAGILIASFIALFIFYNTDSFIYTTGITVKSFSQLGIDLYRYAIGFAGSAMIIWIVYILYPIVGNITAWVNKSLTYCGQVSLTIYIIDCLLNENPNPPAMLGRLEENVLGMRK